jgi:epoxyqueuosine reductase
MDKRRVGERVVGAAPDGRDPRAAIRRRAMALGFDAVRFAPAVADPAAAERYHRFLALGRHGSMDWLARNAARRADPRMLWPQARSAIVCAMSYGPVSDPLATLPQRERATISVYARNRDYHNLLKGRLKQLAGWLHGRYAAQVKVFVDTAPILEKPLAARAGVGWQGKHTNLVSRDFGSWLFLGEVLTDLEMAADEREVDHCGSCRRCLDICPTDAFPAPYQLDARRCISYLTIEHKEPIAAELRPLIGNRIYGCDDCLAVCPWNKFAQAARETGLRARPELDAPALAELAALDDAAFRKLFAGSPIKRIGRDRFVRNVLIAIGNSGMAGLVPAAAARLRDASPLVRGMAVWALARLPGGEAALAAGPGDEADAAVLAEWRAAGHMAQR